MGAFTELLPTSSPTPPTLRIFLCGDVMTGRGIDQVLPHPCDPQLHEDYANSALHYVRLAEQVKRPNSAERDSFVCLGRSLGRIQPCTA